RSRNSASTARSASDTGELPSFIQLLIGFLNDLSASAPASRTVAVSSCASAARSMVSDARNGEPLDPHGRRIDAVAEGEIVRRHQRSKDVVEVARDGDLAHRIGELAVLD